MSALLRRFAHGANAKNSHTVRYLQVRTISVGARALRTPQHAARHLGGPRAGSDPRRVRCSAAGYMNRARLRTSPPHSALCFPSRQLPRVAATEPRPPPPPLPSGQPVPSVHERSRMRTEARAPWRILHAAAAPRTPGTTRACCTPAPAAPASWLRCRHRLRILIAPSSARPAFRSRSR